MHRSKKKAAIVVSDKKEKKNKKKLKRLTRDKSDDKELERSNTPPLDIASTTSISDVFADHLMRKAKETASEPIVMKAKSEINVSKSGYDEMNNDFDIPTISEIAKNAVEKVVCRKEFTELEELQKKINQAKRQLRQITDESEDDDFINLRPDKHDLETAYRNEEASIYSSDSNNVISKSHDIVKTKPSMEPISVSQTKEINNATGTETSDDKRRSVRDRLGIKIRKESVISLSANRRVEQALYVPGYRRNETEKEIQSSLDRHNKSLNEYISSQTDIDELAPLNRTSRCRRDQIQVVTDLRQKVQTKRFTSDKVIRPSILNREQVGLSSINKRIGSRIIVAPPRSKIVLERKKEAIVSSIVNVQPRPVVPKSKQACKSLLLRAVAEAQKSTALVKPTHQPQFESNHASNEPNINVYSMDKVSPKRNIIVEVETSPIIMESAEFDKNAIKEEHIHTNEFVEEEYDPEDEPHLIKRDLDSKYVYSKSLSCRVGR